MFFRIEKSILNVGSGVYTGVVVASGLNNKDANPYILKLLNEQIEKVYRELEGKNIKELSELDEYRNSMKSFGINPSKYPCSIEAILTRIMKKHEFPSVSPVVDLGNYISIKYKLPVGVHDINTMNGDLEVRLSVDSDCTDDNKVNGEELKAGEPVYAVNESIRTRKWLWRQMPAGRVTETSTDFIFPIDGFQNNKDTVDAACTELVDLLDKLFGVEAEKNVINSENPEVRFGKITEEEKNIENQISIMLKGVAEATNVAEIRKKVTECRRENRPLRIKLGLDPSAPDIHIGHAVVLRKIRQLQDLGHVAVIIIGDYTGMIGDPTGKSKTRKQLSKEDVKRNAETYMEQIFKIIDRNRTEVHFNSEWLSKMNFGDVIELASKCTVARMLERDDFNNRYTNHLPLSVHEFFYPLMQAYDSVAIKADIELGGTDQTFNILMGRNIQRDYGQEPQLTLFMPLLEGIDGVEKMSKSLGNYIGISEEPAVIYEKTMKIPDDKIIKYFNLCTDRHPTDVAKIQQMLDAGANPRDVKMILAHEITELYAGKEAADEAEERFKLVYQKNQIPDDAPTLNIILDGNDKVGELLISALVSTGLFKSKSEIRRLFLQGGVQLNGEKVQDISTISSLNTGDSIKVGKNKYFILNVR